MNYVSDNSLGGQLKPIHNNIELTKAMKGRRNCYLYTVGTFPINEENLYTLKTSNIKLVGLAFAQAQFEPRKEKKQITKPLNIVLDEIHELPLNVAIGIDISEHKDRYINGGMH